MPEDTSTQRTEHIAPASIGSTCEASPGSNDITIKSLADVISKLASECDESAVALCNAARMLQRGAQAEIRNLCKPWGVQLNAKNKNGKYSKRNGDILKSELTATFIKKSHVSTLEPKQTKVSSCSTMLQLRAQNFLLQIAQPTS